MAAPPSLDPGLVVTEGPVDRGLRRQVRQQQDRREGRRHRRGQQQRQGVGVVGASRRGFGHRGQERRGPVLVVEGGDGEQFRLQAVPLAAGERAEEGRGRLAEVQEHVAVEHGLGAALVREERGKVGRVDDAPVGTIGRAWMIGQERDIAPDPDAVPVEPDRHRGADMGDRGRVAVAVDRHERFAGDRGAGEQAEIVRRCRQRTTLGRFGRQPPDRRLISGIGGADVTPREPVCALDREIGVVGKTPAGQEVALDPLDQRLDAPLLVGGTGIARLGVEAHLPGELQQSRCPTGLPGCVPPTRDRLHVVEDEHPRYPVECHEAVNEAPEEGFLTHVGRKAHPAPATVLETADQKVAGRGRLLGEGETAHLTPVDLEVLPRQALEADRDLRCGGPLCELLADAKHPVAEDAAAAGIRVIRILPGQFEHPHRRQPLGDPLLDLVLKRIDLRTTVPLSRLPRHRLVEDPGNRRRAPTQLGRNLPDALPPLGHQVYCAAFHLP